MDVFEPVKYKPMKNAQPAIINIWAQNIKLFCYCPGHGYIAACVHCMGDWPNKEKARATKTG